MGAPNRGYSHSLKRAIIAGELGLSRDVRSQVNMRFPIPRAVRRHQDQKQSLERAGSSQSRQGLDWMNFFTADVQTGFGAFVSLYLAELQWSQESVASCERSATILPRQRNGTN